MRNRLFTLILLFSAVLLSACNGAAPISPGVDECTVATQTTDCKDPAKPVCKDDGTGKMTCQAKPSSGDECTVATQTTDCKDPAKPVCKDDGTGKMTCQAECTVATQTTDCTDPAKPACKDDGTGKMTCQAECTAATQSTDCTDPAKPVCKDDGTGKMTCQAKPSSGDECTDNNGCTDHSKPYCDTSASPKVCRAAKDVDECKALNPNPGVCEKVTYDATSGCGTETITTAQNGDGCCPSGADHTTDADCPATDECTDNTGCSGATPICDTSVSPKVCRKAKDLSECESLLNPTSDACKVVTYDATSGCGVSDKAADAMTKDSCCPAGADHTTDADCPAAPVDCSTDTSVCTGATPICKDAGGGKKTCQAASGQSDCDALPTDKDKCEKYTYDSSKHVCNLESGNRAGDSCCPKGSSHTDDADCDECTDNTGCSGTTPICDTTATPKVCRAANDQADCDALPTDKDKCEKYTYDSSKHVCNLESGNRAGDSCCPKGSSHTDDADCPVDCSTDTSVCTGATPICKDAGGGKKTCQAASGQADCNTLVTASNTTCLKYTYNAGACVKTEGKQTVSDSCCPSGEYNNVGSSQDPDCPTKCNTFKDCMTGDVCKEDSNHTKICQKPSTQLDCGALPTDKDTCEKYTYDSSKHVCNLESGNRAGDSCCPKGSKHTDDADCDECSDNTGCSGATPICDINVSPKVCRAAKDKPECESLLNPTSDTCKEVTHDSSGCHVSDKAANSTTKDSCCPSGADHTTDADCDECTDNSGCSGSTPICDTSASPKVCRSAKSVAECKTLNPNPAACQKVTYDATSGCGMESITTDKNSDGCCLPGHYSDVDNDCPVKCSTHSDCTDPAKPICLEDANHTKVCQAPLTAKVGGACLQDDDCGAGGFCMTEAKTGYPGGYCVIPLPGCSTDSKICSTNIGVSGKTSECVTVSISTSSFDMCFQGCSSDKDCRSGYACDSTGDHSCWPNVVSFKVDKAGQDCNTADDCQEDPSYPDDRIECKKAPAGDGDTWRNGYCTADCSADPGVCPTGMTCADVDGQKRCLVSCDPVTNAQNKSSDSYGRPAYMCVELPGGSDPHKGVYVSKKGVGAPCDSNLGTPGNNTSQIDGTCQVGYQCKEGSDFPGGYCVSTASSCPDGSAHFDGSSECYKTCSTVSDSPTDCRSGYKCIAGTGSSASTNFCLKAAPSATSGGAGGAGSKDLGQSCTDDNDCKAGTGMVCYEERGGKAFCTIITPNSSNDSGKDCYDGKGKYYGAKQGKYTGHRGSYQMPYVCFPKATGASDCKAPLSAYEPSWGTCAD